MAGVPGMRQRYSTSPAYADAIRARIRAGGIAKRLEYYVLGKIEMSASQVTAALGLLRKVVPDLAVHTVTGADGGPIQFQQVDDLELARRIAYALTTETIEKAARKEPEHA